MILETASWVCRLPRLAKRTAFGIVLAVYAFSLQAWAESSGLGPASSPSVAETAPDVRQSWEDDYASLKAALSKRDNPYALLRTGEERKDVAHIQSLLWESDRTPADVALRRTEALLEHLKSMPQGARSRGLGKAIGGRPIQEHRGGG